MKTKEFSVVIVLLSLAGVIFTATGLELQNTNLPSDFMPKYMQQNIKQDLDKLSLLDKMLSTAAPSRTSQEKISWNHPSTIRKLKPKNRSNSSRKLQDHELMLNSLYDNLYPSTDDLMGNDSTSSIVISRFGVPRWQDGRNSRDHG